MVYMVGYLGLRLHLPRDWELRRTFRARDEITVTGLRYPGGSGYKRPSNWSNFIIKDIVAEERRPCTRACRLFAKATTDDAVPFTHSLYLAPVLLLFVIGIYTVFCSCALDLYVTDVGKVVTLGYM